MTFEALLTTWLFVTMSPSAVMRKPEPSPSACRGAGLGVSFGGGWKKRRNSLGKVREGDVRQRLGGDLLLHGHEDDRAGGLVGDVGERPPEGVGGLEPLLGRGIRLLGRGIRLGTGVLRQRSAGEERQGQGDHQQHGRASHGLPSPFYGTPA